MRRSHGSFLHRTFWLGLPLLGLVLARVVSLGLTASLEPEHSEQAVRQARGLVAGAVAEPLVTLDRLSADENADLATRAVVWTAVAEPFDDDAPVLLVAGEDREPGRKGFDDDFDGVVDNLSELGAFGSDDHCATPVDPQFESVARHPQSRVISRGAFVPLGDADSFDPAQPWRIVLHGRTESRRWVWPVEVVPAPVRPPSGSVVWGGDDSVGARSDPRLISATAPRSKAGGRR